MSIRFGYSVLLFAFVPSLGLFAAVYEGDKCVLKDGSEGKCIYIQGCSTALGLPRKELALVICGFENINLFVCCKVKELMDRTSTTTTTDRSNNSRSPGDISKQKCEEYAEYAYEKIYSPTLLLNPQFTKNLVCDIQKNKLFEGSILASGREFPHMVVVGFKLAEDHIYLKCGGSLISENFVLTAAHCMVPLSKDLATMFVSVGIQNAVDLTQKISVSEVIPHPKYNNTLYYDIGLLRLSKNVQFNPYVRPACLHTEKGIPYDLAIESGLGIFVTDQSSYLLTTVLELFKADKCNETLPAGELKDEMADDLIICAGTTRKKSFDCHGDTGGPLQVYHKETREVQCMYDIIAINAKPIACALTSSNPSEFTRVSTYIKWIEDIVWPN